MSLHDEIDELFCSLATIDGLTLHEHTCMRESQRRRDCEEQRRRDRDSDPGYAIALRARQRRAQAKRRAARKAGRAWRPMVQLGLRGVSPARGERAA